MPKALRLLMVDESAHDMGLLVQALHEHGYQVEFASASDAGGYRAALHRQDWDLITSDRQTQHLSAETALAIAREIRPEAPFVVVSRDIEVSRAVELVRCGARDYVWKGDLARIGPVAERELRIALSARERSQAVDSLHESQELFKAIVENVGDLVAVLDTEGRRIYNSPSYRPLFREEDIQRGSNSFLEIHPDDRERIRSIFQRTVATGIGECAEFRFVLKDGSIRHMESDGRAIRGRDGSVSRVVVVSRDITALKNLEAELRELAATDILTGLSNRRHFLERMEQELARLHRADGHRAAVLMLDADHFKRINDTFGHVIGDKALRHLAILMQSELRKIDTVGRVGGEEFAFILPGAELAAAEQFAERLRKKISDTPLIEDGERIPLTVSAGVTEMRVADTGADDPLARADRALYRAKESGRNRVAVEA